jgi:hypothetical protein
VLGDERMQVKSMWSVTRLLAAAVASAPPPLRHYSTFLDTSTSFSSLGLGSEVCAAVAAEGFTSPAKIQARRIPSAQP